MPVVHAIAAHHGGLLNDTDILFKTNAGARSRSDPKRRAPDPDGHAAQAEMIRGRAFRDLPEIEDLLRTTAPPFSSCTKDLFTRILLSCLVDADRLDSAGRQGDAASTYFGVFDHLIFFGKDDFFFRGRSRRPPLDNRNALLSFFYTLLANDIVAALECVGLDPQVGFLHRDRPGRPSLALDLMEELRTVLADRLALSLINLRQVTAKTFAPPSGGVIMDDAARKIVLTQWQLRKTEEIIHPFLGERTPLGLIPHLQALLLARHLRGDLDGYPAFFWK